jgi:hypothetical protein
MVSIQPRYEAKVSIDENHVECVPACGQPKRRGVFATSTRAPAWIATICIHDVLASKSAPRRKSIVRGNTDGSPPLHFPARRRLGGRRHPRSCRRSWRLQARTRRARRFRGGHARRNPRKGNVSPVSAKLPIQVSLGASLKMQLLRPVRDRQFSSVDSNQTRSTPNPPATQNQSLMYGPTPITTAEPNPAHLAARKILALEGV